jgi:peptidoglycan/xylan/chitin deacetylase (PgdA/CDA1 family)
MHGRSQQVRLCRLLGRGGRRWVRPPFSVKRLGAGMRVSVTWLCAAALGLLAPTLGAAAEPACAPNSLGVSRTVEIDTTGGPWFGTPRGDKDFLAPGEVVLTFDDGPTPRNTRPILAALSAQCTKATFFMLGEMAAEYPGLVKEIAALGHTIGTHTWSHPNLKRLPEEQARIQIESAFTVIEKAAEQPIAPFFRYPYLSENDAVIAHLQSRNVAQFAIDIDSFDWRTRSPQSVVARVMAGLERRGRGIVLLHDIHASTAGAMPQLLGLLKAKGFKIVHLRPKASIQTLAEYQPPAKAATHEARPRARWPVRRSGQRVTNR